MPACARESTSWMSLAFLAFTSSSSVSRSLMGSVCLLTHFFRAIGLTLPQKPSFDWLLNGLAVWEGCCCAVEGGLSCEPEADCPCCANAGIAIADAKANIANWLGKYRAEFDLM